MADRAVTVEVEFADFEIEAVADMRGWPVEEMVGPRGDGALRSYVESAVADALADLVRWHQAMERQRVVWAREQARFDEARGQGRKG